LEVRGNKHNNAFQNRVKGDKTPKRGGPKGKNPNKVLGEIKEVG